MKNILSSFTSLVFIVLPLALILSIILFTDTIIFFVASVYTIIQDYGFYIFTFLIIVLLPLSFINRIKLGVGYAILIISYYFGVLLWMLSLLVTYNIWGIVALIIGLLIMGIGILPIAIIASIFNGEWIILASLLGNTLLVFGIRYWGSHIINKSKLEIIMKSDNGE